MTPTKYLEPRQKPAVIACAETYGIERASVFHGVKPHLIDKWLRNKDKVLAAAERHSEQMRERARKQYAKTQGHKKPTLATRKRWYEKHVFKRVLKNLSRTMRNKGYAYPLPKPIDLASIAKRQRLICPISGIKLTNDNMSLDHIVPLCKSGNNDLTNLQLVDKRVNMMKHVMSMEELTILCRAIVIHLDKPNGGAS